MSSSNVIPSCSLCGDSLVNRVGDEHPSGAKNWFCNKCGVWQAAVPIAHTPTCPTCHKPLGMRLGQWRPGGLSAWFCVTHGDFGNIDIWPPETPTGTISFTGSMSHPVDINDDGDYPEPPVTNSHVLISGYGPYKTITPYIQHQIEMLNLPEMNTTEDITSYLLTLISDESQQLSSNSDNYKVITSDSIAQVLFDARNSNNQLLYTGGRQPGISTLYKQLTQKPKPISLAKKKKLKTKQQNAEQKKARRITRKHK